MSEQAGKKKRHGRLILWIAIVVVVASFGMRFAALSGEKTVDSIASIQEREGRPVETVNVVTGDITIWTTLAGTVEGIVQYPIISTNSIQVMDVLRKEGDWVKRGDIVIRLEKAAANPMLHSYERSRVLYEDALSDLRRMRVLYKEGAISKQALEKTEMGLKISESDLQDAREGVDLAADYPGVIMSILIKKGEMADNGAILARVARTDTVKIAFTAGSRQAMVLERGQRAVWVDVGNGGSGEGSICRFDLAADPETHLLSGEATFPNPDGNLIPGLLVSFRVLTGDRRGVVKIPVGALIDSGGGWSAYVAEKGPDGKTIASLRKIETGLRTADEVEVVSGLAEGDQVIRFGQSKIKDGDLIKVIGGEEGAK